MGLARSKDFSALIMTGMTRVTNLYLRIKEYGKMLSPGYVEVFYNANRDLNCQMMLIISAVCNEEAGYLC